MREASITWRPLAIAIALLAHAAAFAQPQCPGTAAVRVFADNRSGAAVAIAVEGELAEASRTCTGAGATTYAATLSCPAAPGPCAGPSVERLRPGLWVHRLRVGVPGSDVQEQAQRAVLLAGPGPVTNPVPWTIYPRTFVVTTLDESETVAGSLRAQLRAAGEYTRANPGPALVGFDFSANVFPGTIALSKRPCTPDVSNPPAAICFDDSRVVVDGLDRRGLPGVRWSVDARDLSVLRVYGSDNIFRGIEFVGSAAAAAQRDAVAFTSGDAPGSVARRNRLERCIVRGPTWGDGVSVDRDAGAPDGPDGANTIADSEITGAADRGVKVNAGVGVVARSCVHHNRDGGVLATLGGAATLSENLVQRNLPGTKNGVTVLGTGAGRSTLATRGNLIRFNGARGVSVTQNAQAELADDYVAGNLIRGLVADTQADPGVAMAPGARVRGMGLVCNGEANRADSHGVVVFAARCAACFAACAALDHCTEPSPDPCDPGVPSPCFQAPPALDLGTAAAPGLNAFTSNRVSNVEVEGVLATIPAAGNQWESCPTGGACSLAQDVAPAGALNAGLVDDPRSAAGFRVTAVSPARPQAGDVVRVYGERFNAVGGNPAKNRCGDVELPACAADADCVTGPCTDGVCACTSFNLAVQRRNQQTGANRIRLKSPDAATTWETVFPDAVTPTMLIFTMPWDCFAPVLVQVEKKTPSGSYASAVIPLCDSAGCDGQPAWVGCDDGDAATGGDHCDGAGGCTGVPLPPPTTTSTSSTTTLPPTTTSTRSTTTSTSTSTSSTTSTTTLPPATTTTSPSTTTTTLPVCDPCNPATCGIEQCTGPKLKRRARSLARRLCAATTAGRRSQKVLLRRLEKTMGRCGLTAIVHTT